MTKTWIVECALSRADGAIPFWNTQDAHVRIRFLAMAADRTAMQRLITASVTAGGGHLTAVLSEKLLSADDLRLPEVSRGLSALTKAQPVMLGPPTPDEGAAWEEITWDDLLAYKAGACWAVVSSASWPEFHELIKGLSGTVAQCLFTSTDPQTLAMAPWVVRLDQHTAQTTAIMNAAHERHAFVLMRSRLDIAGLRAHLRRYTMLRTPQSPDVPVYFRFFDSRVMVDMLSGMSEAFLTPFLDPFDSVTVPLSWEIITPPGAKLTGIAPTIFDSEGEAKGRLLSLHTDSYKSGSRVGAASVGGADYASLEEAMDRRGARTLARALWTEFGTLTTQEKCIDIASKARPAAAAYGLISVNQVRTYARCMIGFGYNFPDRYPEANRILRDPALRPWQRKNKLNDWYLNMLFQPEQQSVAERGS